MKHIPELLAPAGNEESLKAAVQAGCDAVYLGGGSGNARMAADHFSGEKLQKAIRYAKLRGVRVYLALNTLVWQDELESALRAAKEAEDLGVDGVIVQDLGLAALIKAHTQLPLHASTQCSVHQLSGAIAMRRLGFDRVILARELSLLEVRSICESCGIEAEVFIHGALCASLSGQCLYSWYRGGRSGNRGKCAQPCRLADNTGRYPLSTKDLMTIDFLPRLLDCGVASLKIEGRLKRPEYVSVAVDAYRKALDLAAAHQEWDKEAYREQLMKVYNRGGFTNGYLTGEKGIFGTEVPNHRGERIGRVLAYHGGKMTIQADKVLHVYDGLSFGNKGIGMEISDLYAGGTRQKEAKGEVTFSSKLSGVAIGDWVYRTTDKRQMDWAKARREQERTQRLLHGRCSITSQGAELTLKLDEQAVTARLPKVPEQAVSHSLTPEEVRQSLEKTGGTVFAFEELEIFLEEGLYLSKKDVNALRREAVGLLEDRLCRPSVRKNQGEPFPNPPYPDTKVQVEISDRIPNIQRDGIFIYDPEEYRPEEIQTLYESGRIDGIWLPHLTTQEDLAYLAQCCRKDKIVICNNIGQMQSLAGKGILWAGIGMNAANSRTVDVLFGLGAAMVMESVECQAHLPHTLWVRKGAIPLMHFAACPKKQLFGCAQCKGHVLRDGRGKPFIFGCKKIVSRHSRLMGEIDRKDGQVVMQTSGEIR